MRDPPPDAGRQTILVVDDAPQNLTLLGELLRSTYRVRAANSGERALRAAVTEPRPDLILLDVMMPEMDGYEVLRRLRADRATRNIPVVFITAMNGTENEEHGLALGAVDYITKPIQPAIVLARVRTHLELKQARDRLAGENEWLEAEVARRTQEIILVQDLSIRALACLAEARDNETGHHILRTQSYVELLAQHLSTHPRFAPALEGRQLTLIVKAAPLHDIGKVGVPDAILCKPGRLTVEEFEIMKGHARIGCTAIERAMDQALSGTLPGGSREPASFPFLQVAKEIALCHHEKWDGSGYPERLVGDDIPVSARLMALADVFDALTTRRVYKPPMPLSAATDLIVEGRGRHFDPDVVDAFISCRDDFAEVSRRLCDPERDPASEPGAEARPQ